MSWPPPHPTEHTGPTRPWDPQHPRDPKLKEDSEQLLYIVVDEIIEEWVGLSVSVWPVADSEGRLRFLDPAGPVEISTRMKAVRAFLRDARTEKETSLAERLWVGATFTARVKGENARSVLESLRERAGLGEARVDDLGDLFENPVDLTEECRELAKLAHYGAIMPAITKDVVEDSG